jgi:hypothetical protein
LQLAFKWLFLTPSSDLLTQKPLATWTPENVQQWLGSLPFWSEKDVAATRFDKNHVGEENSVFFEGIHSGVVVTLAALEQDLDFNPHLGVSGVTDRLY